MSTLQAAGWFLPEDAVQHRPSPQPVRFNGIGRQWALKGELNRARSCFERAVGLCPHFAEAWQNLAHVHFLQRRIPRALHCYQIALKLGIEPNSAASQRWMCWMLSGRFEQAWRETDRLEVERRQCAIPSFGAPSGHGFLVWDGKPLDRRRVVVHCLHGLGDALQFVRYARLLCQAGCEVFLRTPPDVLPLLSQMPEVHHALSSYEPTPALKHDVDIEVMELPYAYRSQLDTLPAQVPYLPLAKPSLLRQTAKLVASPKQLNVGIVWSTSSWDHSRSIPLHHLARLGEIPNVKVYSLQRGEAAEELKQLGLRKVVNAALHLEGICDTAAMIEQLDLVICVDTMVAHLAGGLGRPVWVLLKHSCDWRWMLDRQDSPWYPTMRLFRQPAEGQWDETISMLIERLGALAQAKRLLSPAFILAPSEVETFPPHLEQG